jgi:P4 family phage/plasmid primase-like protien
VTAIGLDGIVRTTCFGTPFPEHPEVPGDLPLAAVDRVGVFARAHHLPRDVALARLRAALAVRPDAMTYSELMQLAEGVNRGLWPGNPGVLAGKVLSGRGEELFDDAGKPIRARFVDEIAAAGPFLALEDSDELLVFRDGFYEPRAEAYVRTAVEAGFRDMDQTSTSHFRREVIDSIRARSYVGREQVNPPGFLVVANGLLDIRDAELPVFGPFDPSVRLTFKLPTPYVPGAECPRFREFLAQIQPDASARDLLQELLGYCLMPGNPHKLAAFWVGKPDTGKSTLQAIFRGVLGPKNVTALSLQSLADSRFAAAGLFGKLANIHGDLPVKVIREIGVFKTLTGGTDEVPAERKFEHPFSFVNPAKLFFSANEMPPVPLADDAFYGRWLILNFDHQVPRDRADPELARRTLEEESPGLLNWALDGLARLAARGRFDLPASAEENRRTWRQKSDSLAWFVDQMLVADPVGRMRKAELYAAYTDFCDEREVEHVKTPGQVSRELPDLFPGVTAAVDKPDGRGGESVRTWHGVRLRDSPGGAARSVESVERLPLSLEGFSRSTGSTLSSIQSVNLAPAAGSESVDALTRPGGDNPAGGA